MEEKKPDLKLVHSGPPPLHESEGGGTPQQGEMPFAVVQGEEVTELPRDLYIPPHALEVFLEAFEGPLDLLLYLIKRQNLDILDIPIAEITLQYVEYIELMKEIQLELAGEYLLMAAMLAEIKSRMLLPRPTESSDEEDDPRAELVRRLQEYERYRKGAEEISGLPRMERDIYPVEAEIVDKKIVRVLPDLDLKELLVSLKEVLARAEHFAHHHIHREALSVRQRMGELLITIKGDEFTEFSRLFDPREGRMGVVVTFLALLELLKERLVELVQAESFGQIHVKSAAAVSGAETDLAEQNSDETREQV
jgi:segregation and condensation protein A